MKEGENLSWVLLHSYAILNVFINPGGCGVALGEILILIWGSTLGRNFDIKLGGLHEKNGLKHGI
jgi:hypothetical protein